MKNFVSLVLVIALATYFASSSRLDIVKTLDQEEVGESAPTGKDQEASPLCQTEINLMRSRGAAKATKKWPEGIVFYTIDSSFGANETAVILDAMQTLSNKTCIRFQKRQKEVDFINITKLPGEGCYSAVGKTGGPQILNLDVKSNCVRVSLVMHELMHSLGFLHEHNRPDRDQFIIILTDNIMKGFEDQFIKNQKDEVELFGTEYDLSSILHYPHNAFSKDKNLSTIIVKGNGTITGTKFLSPTDIRKVNLWYKGVCPPPSSL